MKKTVTPNHLNCSHFFPREITDILKNTEYLTTNLDRFEHFPFQKVCTQNFRKSSTNSEKNSVQQIGINLREFKLLS